MPTPALVASWCRSPANADVEVMLSGVSVPVNVKSLLKAGVKLDLVASIASLFACVTRAPATM